MVKWLLLQRFLLRTPYIYPLKQETSGTEYTQFATDRIQLIPRIHTAPSATNHTRNTLETLAPNSQQGCGVTQPLLGNFYF